jgi:transposase
VPSDKRPTLQAAKLVPSHMAATGRIEKRIVCIQTLKHQRKRSLRAAERAGKHGRGFAQRWLSRKKTENPVTDKRRSGRPLKLSVRHISFIKGLVSSEFGVGSAEIANRLEAEHGVKVSARTVRHVLKREGFQHSLPKQVVSLSPSQRSRRVKWCVTHRNTQKLAFSKVLFTDSKIFTVHPTTGTARAATWHHVGRRPSVAPGRHSKGVHAYMGVSLTGATRLIFVTGGGSQSSPYKDPKCNQLFKGVCAKEYQEIVLPSLLKDGDEMFKGTRWADNWLFQQDNARPHIDAGTKAYLDVRMRDRVLAWPAASPDLSWIENVWAWMEREVRKRQKQINTAAQLRGVLEEVRQSIPSSHLVNYVKSMRGRLKRCIDNEGGPI